MPEFRVERMPSHKAGSDKVVYYVKDLGNNALVTKFDTDTLRAEDIENWESFSPSQQLELKNYLASIRFVIDKLNVPAKFNKDYRFSLPDNFQTALIELFDKAQKNNINFDPMTAMLNGLINHIKTTEKRLGVVGEGSVLSKYDITAASSDKVEDAKQIRKYSKKIFKQLLKIPCALDKYAKCAYEFYGKETNLNSSTINKYIEGKSKPSQWTISCALTVLGSHINITTVLPLETLIPLWLIPLRFSGKLTKVNQAIATFDQIFSAKIADDKYLGEALPILKNEFAKTI